MKLLADHRELAAGIVLVLVLIGAGWVVGAGSWPGTAERENTDCERSRQGLIAQPVNTLSAAVFAATGLLLLADAGRRRRSGEPPVTGVLFGVTAIAIAAGSAAFHASGTDWGGAADRGGVLAFFAVVAVVGLGRLRAWPPRVVTLAAIAVVPLVVVGAAVGDGPVVAAAVVAIGMEGASRSALRPGHRRPLAAAVLLGAAGVVAWQLSRTGRIWCDPNSLLQGHALWHVLAAAAIWAVYRYVVGPFSGAASPSS